MSIRRLAAALLPLLLAAGHAHAQQGLILENKIPLGDVKGRIDHLAIDLKRQRLFVAELGNNTLGVIDLKEGKIAKRITGLDEAQGVAYVAATDTVYVAAGGSGAVSLFTGDELKPGPKIALGRDPDNVRVTPDDKRVYVGYASGAVAVIDAEKLTKLADIALPAHPESFQLYPAMNRIFANVPSAGGQVAVIDTAAGKQIGSWKLPGAGGNFPMAVDEQGGNVIVVTRSPARLFILDAKTGGVVDQMDACGDADDVFVDGKRDRYYVSCGEGTVDIFEFEEQTYRRNRVKTVSGARTSLFVPSLDRLFVAVRANGSEPAAIWVFRPTR